jgi:hypothetical protein
MKTILYNKSRTSHTKEFGTQLAFWPIRRWGLSTKATSQRHRTNIVYPPKIAKPYRTKTPPTKTIQKNSEQREKPQTLSTGIHHSNPRFPAPSTGLSYNHQEMQRIACWESCIFTRGSRYEMNISHYTPCFLLKSTIVLIFVAITTHIHIPSLKSNIDICTRNKLQNNQKEDMITLIYTNSISVIPLGLNHRIL